VQRIGHPEPLFPETRHRVVVRSRRFVVLKQHLDASENQEGGENIQDLAISRDQRGPDPDRYAAQHDHARNVPEHTSALLLARTGKIGKIQRYDKDVIQVQRLFHHKGGQILGCRLRAELPADKATEQDLQRVTRRRQATTSRNANLFAANVQNAKEQNQHRHHDAKTCEPQPKRGCEK
jgi:hypothetical protein